MNFFQSSTAVSIALDDVKPFKSFPAEKAPVLLPLFHQDDILNGVVTIVCKDKKFEHNGILLEFLGILENAATRSTSQFIRQKTELAQPGPLPEGTTTYPFSIGRCEKKFDTYYGTLAKVRYLLRCTILRFNRTVRELEVAIYTDSTPDQHRPLQGSLSHPVPFDFTLKSRSVETGDLLRGTLTLTSPRTYDRSVLDHIDLVLRREETVSKEHSRKQSSKTLCTITVLSGLPDRNEVVPFVLPLPHDLLTPTYPNVYDQLQVNYFVAFVSYDAKLNQTTVPVQLNVWRDNSAFLATDPRNDALLDWLDESLPFDEVLEQEGSVSFAPIPRDGDFPDCIGVDGDDLIEKAIAKVKSEQKQTQRIEFEW